MYSKYQRIIIADESTDSFSDSMDSLEDDYGSNRPIALRRMTQPNLDLSQFPSTETLNQIKNYLHGQLTSSNRSNGLLVTAILRYLRRYKQHISFNLKYETIYQILQSMKIPLLKRLLRSVRCRFLYMPDVPKRLWALGEAKRKWFYIFWILPWKRRALRPRLCRQIVRGLGPILFKRLALSYPELARRIASKKVSNQVQAKKVFDVLGIPPRIV